MSHLNPCSSIFHHITPPLWFSAEVEITVISGRMEFTYAKAEGSGKNMDFGSEELHVDAAAAAAKSFQSWPTLCDPIKGNPPGSAIPGIVQARTLEWVAISFSKEWKWKVKVKSLSCARLVATRWTAAHQAPPSMGSSRQEYWCGVPLPSGSSFHYISLWSWAIHLNCLSFTFNICLLG